MILLKTIKDYPITLNELQDKIKTLQPKKACGVDGILNEIIKYTDNKFQLAIPKLFNIIPALPHYLEPRTDHPNPQKLRHIWPQ